MKNSKSKHVEKRTKKSVNIGWQEVVKKKKNICISDNGYNEDIQNHSNLITVVNKSYLQSDTQNNIKFCKMEAVNKNVRQNHEDSEIESKTNFESNYQNNAIACKMDSEKKAIVQTEFDAIANESYCSLYTHLNLDDEMDKSAILNIKSLPTNDMSSPIRQPSTSKDQSCEKSIKIEEKIDMINKNYNDTCLSPKSSRLIDDAKRNLTSMLDTVYCTHQVSLPDASHDQQKDSGIDEDSQDKFIKKLSTENQHNMEDIVKETSILPESEETEKITEEIQKDHNKDISPNVEDNILKEQDIDNIEAKKIETDSLQLNLTDKGAEINDENVTTENSNNQKKQLQPKVLSTRIVSQKYRIVQTDVNLECSPIKLNMSTSPNYPNVISNNTNTSFKTTQISTAQEVYERQEENNTDVVCCVSLQTKKQFQQQTENSNSNGSKDENEHHSNIDRSFKAAQTSTNNSDTSFRFKDNDKDETIQKDVSRKNTDVSRRDDTCEGTSLKSNKKNCASKENFTNILHDDKTRKGTHKQWKNRVEDEEKNYVPEESISILHNKDNREKKNYASEEGISILHDEDNREDVDMKGKERFGNIEKNNISEERLNRPVSLDGKNVSNKADQDEDEMSDHKLESQNVHYRPHNLLQCNLQNQNLILKKETIKFGKNKFRIVHNKASTVSCVFATGKRRKPYKLVNLKEISTVTVREKLSHPMENLVELNSRDIDISSKQKSKKRRYTSSSDLDNNDWQIDPKQKKVKLDYYKPDTMVQ
ncbi:hypothetical protein EAI_06668 [Harpegnathos saltator]|uniref:Uncharacterized protein n=1 Tax=Harpegnathos saltator TaxID=610380 RepID=E2B355_HARSA|nr:hypothetical protein EAI_06668 [Harpegnathos saltator]